MIITTRRPPSQSRVVRAAERSIRSSIVATEVDICSKKKKKMRFRMGVELPKHGNQTRMVLHYRQGGFSNHFLDEWVPIRSNFKNSVEKTTMDSVGLGQESRRKEKTQGLFQ